jgi:DNA-binding transcriptional regulator YdaS (Cro superfamily)
MKPMKKELAIQKAGSAKALADILGVTRAAISQWGRDVPKARLWQLMAVKPEWFNKI